MGELRVVDLFAGLGGFSAGAIEAGAKVVLGIDLDHEALKTYRKNVAGAKTSLQYLGPLVDPPTLPEPSPWLHVHASPPGVDFCASRRGANAYPKCVKKASSVDARATNTGEEMLKWSLDLVIARNDASWSVETMMGPRVRNLLDDYVKRMPDRIEYACFDACEFGAAQNRTRILAGPPALIHELKQMTSPLRVSIRDLFDEHDADLPADYIKNNTRDRYGKVSLRSVAQPSYTITASHPLCWANGDGATVRILTPEESARLSGFPERWQLPSGQRVAQFAVGNAMCVSVASAIVKAALAVAKNKEGAAECDEHEHEHEHEHEASVVGVEIVDEADLRTEVLPKMKAQLDALEKRLQSMEHTFSAQIRELRCEIGLEPQSAASGGKRARR